MNYIVVALLAFGTQVLVLSSRILLESALGAAPRVDAALVAGGLLGVAVGAWRPLSPRWLALWSGGVLLAVALALLGEAPWASTLARLPPGARAAVSAIVLAVCIGPMGGLVPAFARRGAMASRAYAADLIGAAAGALSASFLAAVVGVVPLAAFVGVACVGLAVRPPGAVQPESSAPLDRADLLVAIVLAATVGFAEVALPRLWAPATASAAWPLPAVIAGVLLGGAAGTGLAARVQMPPLLLGAAAFAVLGALAPLWRLGLFGWLVRDDLPASARLVGGHLAVIVVAALPAIASGAALRRVLAASPRIAVASTSLAAAGAALAGPWCVALWGPDQALSWMAVLLLSAMAAVALRRPLAGSLARRVAIGVAAFCSVVVAGAGILQPPDLRFATTDLSRGILLRIAEPQALPAQDLVFDQRDVTGRIVVADTAGDRTLFHDGKPDASSRGDLETQALLGLLPLLYAPDAKDALVVGLGSGATARWLADAGVHVVAAEVSPRTVEAAVHFEGPLPDNIEVVLYDGRAIAAGHPSGFDVVTIEPTNLFAAGMTRFYTREAQAALAGAARRGVVVVWLHAYLLDDGLAQDVIRAMTAHHEDVDAFPTLSGDVLFVGHQSHTRPDAAGWLRRVAARAPCALAAIDAWSADEWVERRIPLDVLAGPAPSDLRPQLAPRAVRALLERRFANPILDDRQAVRLRYAQTANVLSAAAVVTLLTTRDGRQILQERAAGIELLPSGLDPPWAFALARAGLAGLGGRADPPALTEARRAMESPRCTPQHVRQMLAHLEEMSARQPGTTATPQP